MQRVLSYYPEFSYQTYDRILEPTTNGGFQLVQNRFSEYKNRVHFTPLDFPDGPYTVETYALDAWTPAGMLSGYSTDTVLMKGSVFDDYYVKPGY